MTKHLTINQTGPEGMIKAAAQGAGAPARWEWAVGLVLFAFALCLRIFFIYNYRFDSDEPQHLHVVWAWAHGMMQYRDVFDNHAPLFHMLMSPIVGWLGDRADLLYLMRLAMLPVWGLTLWGTYRLASALSNRRIGWWAAVLACLLPVFFINSVEFRTDDLWAMLWVLAMVVLVSGRIRPLRSMAVGLILGAAISVSMKTTLLISCLAFGGLVTAALCRAVFRPGWQGRIAVNIGVAALGAAIIPTALALWFYANGAFDQMYYGVIQHNILAGLGGRKPILLHSWMFFPMLIAILGIAWALIVRRGDPGPQTARRVLIFVSCAVYIAAVLTLWPLVTAEDFLPAWPLLMVSVAPFLDLRLPRRLTEVFSGRMMALSPAPTLLLVSALLGAVVLTAKMPWRNETANDLQRWKTVLSLTGKDDYVMDPKAGMIFRRRPVYYVFERITNVRIMRGLIDPEIPRHLIETKTMIVNPTLTLYPEDARAFIEANYISVGQLRVAGMMLSERASGAMAFDIAIPATYRLVTPTGYASGELDGAPYTGPRRLGAGHHEFRPFVGEHEVALIWAKAAKKGLSPFASPAKHT